MQTSHQEGIGHEELRKRFGIATQSHMGFRSLVEDSLSAVHIKKEVLHVNHDLQIDDNQVPDLRYDVSHGDRDSDVPIETLHQDNPEHEELGSDIDIQQHSLRRMIGIASPSHSFRSLVEDSWPAVQIKKEVLSSEDEVLNGDFQVPV
ncbi:unnamed protein product, partial [Meganyctiphanes norvegica]